MADYYPLIARAVEGLPDAASPEARRSVYERARTALMAQLRSLDPPLSEVEIGQERISLDAAIARVEAEYAPVHASSSAAPVPADPPVLRDTARRVVDQVPMHAAPDHSDRTRPFGGSGEDEDAAQAYQDTAPARPRIETRPHPGMQNSKRTRTIVLSAVLALVLAAFAIVAYVANRDQGEDVAAQTPVAEAPAAADAGSGKVEERVGGQVPPAPAAPRQEIGVAHRSVFYEEDPANPQVPKAQVGRVVWRLEDVNPGQGQPLEKAVTASIDIPDAGLTMKMVLRRNLDTTLPASHTVELSFTTREGDSGRVIRDIGLLQFKNEEAARGTPVAGLPVPVRENLFLIGLSNLQGDVERNTELFIRRNWIDLPVRMASGQRAILSFEKGASGEQVLNDAFRQWQ